MHKNIEKILVTSSEITKEIKKAAKWVDSTYPNDNKDLVLIGLLRGCIPFYGELTKQIKRDIIMDFMTVSSFQGGTQSTGKPKIITDIELSIEGKDVLLVDDIIDSANTIKYTIDYLKQRNPSSIKVISLMDKKSGRKVKFEPDYYCFDMDDYFLVGFGLDYKEKLRNIPYIGIFKKDTKE